MAPQTRGQKRQITTTKETTTTSPQTRGGGGGKGKSRKRQATTKATTTRGGEGGRTTKETTTTSNENPTNIQDYEEGNIQDYEEEQLSDDESYLPARATVLDECRRQKEKLKEESKRKLKSLTTYLEKMGIPAAQTLEQAIRQLIEGSLVDRTKRDLISKQISEYILLRWGTTRRIFGQLIQLSVWDGEVIRMVYELSKDLKDLPVRVPKIEDIASDAAYVLEAKEGWFVRMAKELQYRVALWLCDTRRTDATMKEWAKCPTRTIVMKKPDGPPCLGYGSSLL